MRFIYNLRRRNCDYACIINILYRTISKFSQSVMRKSSFLVFFTRIYLASFGLLTKLQWAATTRIPCISISSPEIWWDALTETERDARDARKMHGIRRERERKPGM